MQLSVELGWLEAGGRMVSSPRSRSAPSGHGPGSAWVASGSNRPTLSLTDRAGLDQPLMAGDRIVTSGDGGVFPPGVPVGTITDARAEPPLIRPAAGALGAGLVTIEAAYLPVPEAEKGPVFDAPVPAEARRKGTPAPRLRSDDPSAR